MTVLRTASFQLWLVLLVIPIFGPPSAQATPANRAALAGHYDHFLPGTQARCRTCHLPSDRTAPERLEDFPHNPFGARLRELGTTPPAGGTAPNLATRLQQIAGEDSDHDGAANEVELLLGHNPGDAHDTPTADELRRAAGLTADFAKFLAGYRWRPFEPVQRPAVPTNFPPPISAPHPIDAFVAAEWSARKLSPRPEAARDVLLRRVYQDLIGLNPTPEEQEAFRQDPSPDAYEQVVDRLLSDPRHGERWARHWMDVWRYSDWAGWTDGGQVRDSKPHIWRWRDWIVESLNTNKPYDRMLQEMLAADELTPEDPDALRATGFLARNYKLLSREQWLEDTVKHTAQAFLGVTMGCAKCHDHRVDPISQREYYAFRAIFEPHQVRTDRVPGELDITKDGLPRAFDALLAPTYFLVRGDERHPLTNEVIQPGVPAALGGKLNLQEVALPWLATHPEQRESVIRDTRAAAEREWATARTAWIATRDATNAAPGKLYEAALQLDVSEQRHAALEAVLAAEAASYPTAHSEPSGQETPPSPAATNAVYRQRLVAVTEARLKQARAQASLMEATPAQRAEAQKKWVAADQEYTAAKETLERPLDGAFKPRPTEAYPASSSGRRRALAQWLTAPENPLTARVAVNQVWLRHFGRGLVPTPSDFGHNGRPPTHPQLLDWLAAEFVHPTSANTPAWSFRHLHRLMVTSAAYRRASTPDAEDLAADPDNEYLWRMNSRRLEAEAVRDNLLFVTGSLDLNRGGPDVDQKLALTSNRRSLYLRHAAEKQAEFLQVFDGPSVTECYERRASVMPQQALALGNSELAVRQARALAEKLRQDAHGDSGQLVHRAFQKILARTPTPEEIHQCRDFLAAPIPVGQQPPDAAARRGVDNLLLVLLNHSDFVTVR